MSEDVLVITLIVTLLSIATVFLILRVQPLLRNVLALRDQVSLMEVRLSELHESNQQLATAQRELLAEVSRRDAYEAFDSHHQMAIDSARDCLSLQRLRQKYGIPSHSTFAECSPDSDRNSVAKKMGGGK